MTAPAPIKDRILAIVQSATNSGMPINKIADKAGISVATTSKFVHILAAERKVKIERFGDMKLVRAGR